MGLITEVQHNALLFRYSFFCVISSRRMTSIIEEKKTLHTAKWIALKEITYIDPKGIKRVLLLYFFIFYFYCFY